ncbi:uncharacterized protein EHS24_003261 [Apiotrichum porosum]|uniref:Uncharacterized protein n=1 Tax=Apiotrichum porosum TaxID=105984 RepID=A0A427XG54_9TREE|nr:uncharacterized protein EHS24_003261 [Apiotrichum porosum]RSH77694.1 hypothetical protein EHS24_003261 [Apiotrichum porosum]
MAGAQDLSEEEASTYATRGLLLAKGVIQSPPSDEEEQKEVPGDTSQHKDVSSSPAVSKKRSREDEITRLTKKANALLQEINNLKHGDPDDLVDLTEDD